MSVVNVKMFSVMGICLVTSFLFASLSIKPTEARCSQTKEYTLFDPNKPNVELCQSCPICPPGKGLPVQCGSRVKNGTFIGCQNCENETYSDHNDTSHCKSCDQCGYRMTLRQCTSRQNSICSTTNCTAGHYMDTVVDDCLPTPETPKMTSVKSTASTINKRLTLKLLLTKNVTLTPTVSTRPAKTTEPPGRNATYCNSSTTVDERTKLRSQPTNSTTPVSPSHSNKLFLLAIIGGSLGGAPLICFIIYISVKFNQYIYRALCCLEREGLEGGEELPLTEFEIEDHLVNKCLNDGRTTPCLEDYHNKNSATTSSDESISSASEESTNENPNFYVQHIPEDCLVRDTIVKNVYVMDELARRLDRPAYSGDQYWEHLAAEFQVPEEVKMKCQHSFENSPSKHMLEVKEGDDTNFSVQQLKDGLKAICRNDLVQTVKSCHLASTATLRELRESYPTIFESICLRLDHYDNWKALGLKISIPDETLKQIATSSSCAKTVLEIIEKKNPSLTVKEMRLDLKNMRREDVCNVLDKYKLQDSHTIVTLRKNINCLEEVAILLDKETPGMKNWLHFARKFGVSQNECDSLKPKEKPSPTKAFMEQIVQVDPDLTVKTFIEVLIKLQRKDVVNALGKFICGNRNMFKKC